MGLETETILFVIQENLPVIDQYVGRWFNLNLNEVDSWL